MFTLATSSMFPLAEGTPEMRELMNPSRELRNNRGDHYVQPCKRQDEDYDPDVFIVPEQYTAAERQQAKMLCRSVCSRRLECIVDALVPDKGQDMATQGIWAGEVFPSTFDEAMNSTYDRLVDAYKVLSGTGEPPIGFKHRRRGEKPDPEATPKTPKPRKPRKSRAKKKPAVAATAEQIELITLTPPAESAKVTTIPVPAPRAVAKTKRQPDRIVVGDPLALFAIPA